MMPQIAWARYGATGFVLASTLSKTHVQGTGGRTRCGVQVPSTCDERVVSYGTAGAGRCGRCFG